MKGKILKFIHNIIFLILFYVVCLKDKKAHITKHIFVIVANNILISYGY